MEDKASRKVYRKGYDTEYWEQRALSIYSDLTRDECQLWLKNPCTQALLHALQADIAGIVAGWINGGYSTAESIDATAQEQAKARGMAQACDDIIETINSIGTRQFGGIEDNGDTSGGS